MLNFGVVPILVIFVSIEGISAGYYDEYGDYHTIVGLPNYYQSNDEYGYYEYIKTIENRNSYLNSNITNTTKVEDKYPVVTLVLESANELVYGPNWRSSLNRFSESSKATKYDSSNWRAVFANDMDTNNDGVLSQEEISVKVFNGMELVYKILSPGFSRVLRSDARIEEVSISMNDILELADFYIDLIPEKDFSFDYGYYLDEELDGFVSLIEIVDTLNFVLGSKLQLTNDAVEVLEEMFTYLDSNNDGELSIIDLKLKLKDSTQVIFNFLDQRNDGRMHLSEITSDFFRFEYDDLDYVLASINATGDVNINHFLIPFGVDMNEDGVVNNFDFYFLEGDKSISDWYDLGIFFALDALKLIDQDQDGVFKSEEMRNFALTLWHLLDADKDRDVSLDDGYHFLQTLFNVNQAKMIVLKDYVINVKSYVVDEMKRFAKFTLEKMDQNYDSWISLKEFYQMPMLCLNKMGNSSCFQSNNFPIVPMSLDESYFLAHLKWNGIFSFQNYNGDYFFDLVVPFVYYILESPEFYPKKGMLELVT